MISEKIICQISVYTGMLGTGKYSAKALINVIEGDYQTAVLTGLVGAAFLWMAYSSQHLLEKGKTGGLEKTLEE